MTDREIPRCGRPKANGQPCMRRQRPCSEHATPEEKQATLEWAVAEVARRDEVEREWLAATTAERPTFMEAEALQWRGIPACHQWEVPPGPPPPHLEPVDILRCWQADECAICSASRGRLLVDHCHRSGLIRGLLCTSCNTAEGLSGAAVYAAYRLRPPAVMLGVEAQYGSPWDGFGNLLSSDRRSEDERNMKHVDAAEALFGDIADRFRAGAKEGQ